MARVTVRQEAHVASHGKIAKGKGSWAFGAVRNPKTEEIFFCKFDTFAACAKEASEHFGVKEVWVQP